MNEMAVIVFRDMNKECEMELEIPLNITANDLILAFNEIFCLGMDVDNIFHCYFVSENPIAFLRGNKLLSDFGVRNGTVIRYVPQQG